MCVHNVAMTMGAAVDVPNRIARFGLSHVLRTADLNLDTGVSNYFSTYEYVIGFEKSRANSPNGTF